MPSSTIGHPLVLAVAGHLPLILVIVIVLLFAFRAFRRRNGREAATEAKDRHRHQGEE